MRPRRGTLPRTNPLAATEGAQEPVNLSGDGIGTSDTFQLNGGNYSVSYDLGAGCDYTADLDDGNGGVVEKLFISNTGGGSGSTSFYGLNAGSYYVDMHTDDGGNGISCPWSITIES